MPAVDSDCETRVDGFLDKSLFVLQRRTGGHRAGLDAVLLAATVPENLTGRVADFGAGSGVVGMAVAHRCAGADVDLLEVDPASASLARQSLKLEQNRSFLPRVQVMETDLTLTGRERERAGLRAVCYDYIVSNPPYNPAALQESPDRGRAKAHVMEAGLLQAWIKTAVFVAKPKAKLTLILRPDALDALLPALAGRFGGVRILPVHPKEGAEASRMIVQATKGSKARLVLLPGFVVHGQEGGFTREAEDIFRGRAGLSI